MLSRQEKKQFNRYMSQFENFRRVELKNGVDPEPFRMPLFSKNFAKRVGVLSKYRHITQYLKVNSKRGKALDFGTGFGAFLPVLSELNDEVIAVDAFDDQLRAAKDLCLYMGLKNVTVLKVARINGLSGFEDSTFDTILATDVLEHNLNYKDIVVKLKRVLKTGGPLIVSLPREHLLYRIFARREVEHDRERGHVYHSSKGADEVELFLLKHFDLELKESAHTFIHYTLLRGG
ncbi:class I SAM-dependent methyltransferase [Thermogymnomonas acidicola]|nr:class I SAM-dependent methyltransferase [Thermogymnomonas acidicola]